VANCDGVTCTGCGPNTQACAVCNSSQLLYAQKLCCVEHGGTSQSQFNDSHVDCATLCSSGALWEATYTFYGMVPDMSNQTWIPPGRTSCDYDCTRPKCYPLSITISGSSASPNGPMEFLGCTKCAKTNQKKQCKWWSKNVCGDNSTPRKCIPDVCNPDGDNLLLESQLFKTMTSLLIR
jgi:hypothetical protein